MWIKNNFIDITRNKMNIYISLDNRKTFIYFSENITAEEYNKLKQNPEFIKLDDFLKFNIILIGPIRYNDIEFLILNTEKIESDFDKMFSEDIKILDIYNENMINFLKEIKNNKVFEYNKLLKGIIKAIKKEKLSTIKEIKKEINNKIDEILKEIEF